MFLRSARGDTRGSRGKIFFKWALKSKKQVAKNYCNTKMPQHFHRLFSVLKIELKTKFFFLNYHLMSLNAKKILENIFCKFYMSKISILKKFPVFRPLFREIFFYFFLHILKDYFFNYKCCKFQKGF